MEYWTTVHCRPKNIIIHRLPTTANDVWYEIKSLFGKSYQENKVFCFSVVPLDFHKDLHN